MSLLITWLKRLPGPALDFIDVVLNGTFFLSVINKIELLGFQNLSAKDERQFHDLINTSKIIPIYDEIIEEPIALRKTYSIKLPDAIIAASAITVNATLITSDLAGFRKVSA